MMYGSARAVEHRTHQNSVAVAEHQDSKNKGKLIRDYLMCLQAKRTYAGKGRKKDLLNKQIRYGNP